jgi:hypothetical protein
MGMIWDNESLKIAFIFIFLNQKMETMNNKLFIEVVLKIYTKRILPSSFHETKFEYFPLLFFVQFRSSGIESFKIGVRFVSTKQIQFYF